LYQHDLFENKPQNILIASEGFQELIGIFILVSILRLAFIAIRKDRVQYCCVCFKIALSTAVFSICGEHFTIVKNGSLTKTSRFFLPFLLICTPFPQLHILKL